MMLWLPDALIPWCIDSPIHPSEMMDMSYHKNFLSSVLAIHNKEYAKAQDFIDMSRFISIVAYHR